MTIYFTSRPCPSDPRDIAASTPPPSPAVPDGIIPSIGMTIVPVDPAYRARLERSARHGALAVLEAIDPDAPFQVTFEDDQQHLDAITDAMLWYLPGLLLRDIARSARFYGCWLDQIAGAWLNASFPGMLVACEQSEIVTEREHPELVDLAIECNRTLRDIREAHGLDVLVDAMTHLASAHLPMDILEAAEHGADGLRPIDGEYDPMDFFAA